MQFSLSTGQAARVLGITEPQLNQLIRSQRLSFAPPASAGRRLWSMEHLLHAATVLDVQQADLVTRIDLVVSGSSLPAPKTAIR